MKLRDKRGSRRFLGRATWGVADQAVSSITNFGITVLVARLTNAHGFGVFAAVFLAYFVTITVARAVTGETLAVGYTATTPEALDWGIRAAGGAACLVGLCGSLICFCLVALGGEPLTAVLLILGATLPALVLQDFWRYCFFAQRRPKDAFVNDLVWSAILGPTVAILYAGGSRSVAVYFLAWALSGVVAGLFGFIQVQAMPEVGAAVLWFRRNRELVPRYVGEAIAVSGASQLSLYVAGLIAGFGALGALRAGQVLLGPFTVLLMGAGVIAIPEAVAIARHSTGPLLRSCAVLAGVLGMSSLGWGLVLLWLPSVVGRALVGDSWTGARGVLFPLTLALTSASLAAGAGAGLRALAAAKRGLRARAISGLWLVIGSCIGALATGAQGAAWGIAVGALLGAVLLWREFILALGEPERTLSNVRASQSLVTQHSQS